MLKKKNIVKTLLIAFIGTIIVAVCAAALLINYRYPLRYFDIISEYAWEYDLEPSLICAVIHAESGFNKDAVSRVGASGLMQITEDTAYWLASKMGMEDFSYEQIFDPEVNIRMGCFYLSMLIKQFEDLNVALCAYNAGSGNVGKWLANTEYSDDGDTLKYIPFQETRNYAKKIPANQEIYEVIIKLRG